MYGERDVANAHAEIFRASECTGRAAVCAFHAENTPSVDLRAYFFCKVFSYDDYLGALVQDTGFCAKVVYEHIYFS
jgi:hypothetical protein